MESGTRGRHRGEFAGRQDSGSFHADAHGGRGPCQGAGCLSYWSLERIKKVTTLLSTRLQNSQRVRKDIPVTGARSGSSRARRRVQREKALNQKGKGVGKETSGHDTRQHNYRRAMQGKPYRSRKPIIQQMRRGFRNGLEECTHRLLSLVTPPSSAYSSLLSEGNCCFD